MVFPLPPHYRSYYSLSYLSFWPYPPNPQKYYFRLSLHWNIILFCIPIFSFPLSQRMHLMSNIHSVGSDVKTNISQTFFDFLSLFVTQQLSSTPLTVSAQLDLCYLC